MACPSDIMRTKQEQCSFTAPERHGGECSCIGCALGPSLADKAELTYTTAERPPKCRHLRCRLRVGKSSFNPTR
jgi:hypothetical protein